VFKFSANGGEILGFILVDENITRLKKNEPVAALLSEQGYSIEGRPGATVLIVYLNEYTDRIIQYVKSQKDIVMIIELDDATIDTLRSQNKLVASKCLIAGKEIEIQFGVMPTAEDAAAYFKDKIGPKSIVRNEAKVAGFGYANN
jgi:hypothetical protein